MTIPDDHRLVTRDAIDPLAVAAGGNQGVPAPRLAVIGDSIENLFSYVTPTLRSFGDRDWPTYAMLLSAGRIRLVRNAGVGGESTSDYLARFDTDVTADGTPNTVVIGGGENDIQEGVPIATTRANIEAMVAKTYALGATPVLRTTMPHSLSNAVRQKIGAVNHWTRNYGADHGIGVLDFWAQVVDPATGQYQAALTADGVHPSAAGAKILGQYVVDTLCARMPTTALSLPADPTDAGQLAPTPLFTTDVSGTPTLWNAIGGSPAGVTRSMVTDPLVPGRMARIANVGSTAAVSLQTSSSRIDVDDASPGDVLEVAGLFTSDGGVTATVTAVITYNDGTVKTLSRVPVSAVKSALTRATYHVRMPPIPVGFMYMQVTLGTGSGTGVVDYAYPSVRNLTREGLL